MNINIFKYDVAKEHGENGDAIMKSILKNFEKSINAKNDADHGTSNVKFNAALTCINQTARIRLTKF